MKVARLHTGEELRFPPETPDDAIHAAVRKKLGIPDPPTPPDPSMAAQQDMVALMQNVLRTLQGLTMLMNQNVAVTRGLSEQVAQMAARPEAQPDMSPVVSAIQKSHGQVMQAHQQVAKAVNDSHQGIKQAIDNSHKQITSAIKAPRKVQFDKNKRPIGVTAD